MTSADSLRELFADQVDQAGLDLEDVNVSRIGKRVQIRVTVDQDGGVELDQVAKVSRALSAILDENDQLFNSAFVLEVSSPGVDRPLSEPRHWRRALKRLVRVSRADGSETVGRIVSVADESAVLNVDGADLEIPFSTVQKAVVQVELNPPKESANGH